MALPSKSDLLSLDYRRRGLPFARVEAQPMQTTSMDSRRWGLPFVSVAPSFQAAWTRSANAAVIGGAVNAA